MRAAAVKVHIVINAEPLSAIADFAEYRFGFDEFHYFNNLSKAFAFNIVFEMNSPL